MKDSIKKLKNELLNFDFSKTNSKTQISSEKAEIFVENILKNYFKNVKIFKNHSQGHPDFIMMLEETYNSFSIKFKEKLFDKKGFKDVFNWEKKEENNGKVVKIEVKRTNSNVYKLNDIFPSPLKNEETIYFLFSTKLKKIFLTTSCFMGDIDNLNPTIEERLLNSKELKEKAREDLKKIWGDVKGVDSYPRLNFSMNSDYAHKEVSESYLAEIFKKGGF